ncbi:MAG: hypothetical protein HYU66_09335 [Armatimonadetes bacterium]|nr:hypothetical protein [Armatimonadota bacterium]
MWLLGALLTATLIGVSVFVRQSCAGRLECDRRQFVLRVTAGVVLSGVWVSLGVVLLGVDPRADPHLAVACAESCVLLALCLPLIAVLDLSWSAVIRLRHEARHSKELADLWVNTFGEARPRHESPELPASRA